ncbi:MAG: hypothetical protein ACRENL_02765 [Candidatus Dormibacteria bacterium]
MRRRLVDHVGELDVLLVALKDAWKVGDEYEARGVIGEAIAQTRLIDGLLASLQ